MKQILLTMNEKDHFIIEDLDDFHIIIKADEEYRIRRQLDQEVRTTPVPEIFSEQLFHSWRKTRIAWKVDARTLRQYRSSGSSLAVLYISL